MNDVPEPAIWLVTGAKTLLKWWKCYMIFYAHCDCSLCCKAYKQNRYFSRYFLSHRSTPECARLVCELMPSVTIQRRDKVVACTVRSIKLLREPFLMTGDFFSALLQLL